LQGTNPGTEPHFGVHSTEVLAAVKTRRQKVVVDSSVVKVDPRATTLNQRTIVVSNSFEKDRRAKISGTKVINGT
jgi:hypothetical protein